MASFETISEIFVLLQANWPNYEYTERTMELYERCLYDVPDEVLEAAAIQCVRDCTFFPKVAELKNASYSIMIDEMDLPTPFEAWQMVQAHLRKPPTLFRGGQHYRLAPLPPLIEKAVAGVGGWYALRHTDNLVADRARFYQCYEAVIRRERQRLEMLPEVKRVAERMSMPLLGDGHERN